MTNINEIKDRLEEIAEIFSAYYSNPSDEAWAEIEGDALADEEEELEAELKELEAYGLEELEADADEHNYYSRW